MGPWRRRGVGSLLLETALAEARHRGARSLMAQNDPRADPDGNGTHGLNERVEAKALYTARDYLFDLIKAYAK